MTTDFNFERKIKMNIFVCLFHSFYDCYFPVENVLTLMMTLAVIISCTSIFCTNLIIQYILTNNNRAECDVIIGGNVFKRGCYLA